MSEDTSDTVAVGGTEYPFDELQMAFESYDGKTTKRGHVILTPDGWDGDNDILVVNLQAGTYDHVPEQVIDKALEDALEQSFVEYVRENVSMAEHEAVADDTSFDATIVDDDNQWVSHGTFEDIEMADGVRVREVEYDNLSDELLIHLKDTREGE
jgi:hypothetical protein